LKPALPAASCNHTRYSLNLYETFTKQPEDCGLRRIAWRAMGAPRELRPELFA
jgi:hypothetical protein